LDSILSASFEDIAFDPRHPHCRTPCLLIGYHNGFQIWDLARAHQDSHTANEIISKRWEASVSQITCVQLLDEVDRNDPFKAERPFLALAANDGKVDGLTRGCLHLYSIPQGTFREIQLLNPEEETITEITSNGSWIAVGTSHHRIYLIDILSLKVVQVIEGWIDPEGGLKGPVFTMGAKWIAFQSSSPLNVEIEPTIAKRHKKAMLAAAMAEEDVDGSGGGGKRRDGSSGERYPSKGSSSGSSSSSQTSSGGVGSTSASGGSGSGSMSSLSGLIGSGGKWTQKDVMAIGYAGMREAMYLGSQLYTSVMNSYNNASADNGGGPNFYSSSLSSSSQFGSGVGGGIKQASPGTIEIWSLSKMRYNPSGNSRIAIFTADSTRRIERMAFDKSGMVLATASDGGQNVKVWNAGHLVSSLSSSPSNVSPMYILERGTTLGTIANMSFTEDTSYIAFTTKPKGTTHIFPISLVGSPISVSTHLPGFIPDSIHLSDPTMMSLQPPKLAAIHSPASQNPTFSAITKISSYPLTSSHSDQQRASHAHDKTIYIFYPNGHLVRQDLKTRAELSGGGGLVAGTVPTGGGGNGGNGASGVSASMLSGNPSSTSPSPSSSAASPPKNAKLTMLVVPRYRWELGRPTQGWNQFPTFVPRDLLNVTAAAGGGVGGPSSQSVDHHSSLAAPSSASSVSPALVPPATSAAAAASGSSSASPVHDSVDLLSNVETQTHALDSEQSLVPLPKFAIYAFTELPARHVGSEERSWRSDSSYSQLQPIKLHSPGLPGGSTRANQPSSFASAPPAGSIPGFGPMMAQDILIPQQVSIQHHPNNHGINQNVKPNQQAPPPSSAGGVPNHLPLVPPASSQNQLSSPVPQHGTAVSLPLMQRDRHEPQSAAAANPSAHPPAQPASSSAPQTSSNQALSSNQASSSNQAPPQASNPKSAQKNPFAALSSDFDEEEGPAPSSPIAAPPKSATVPIGTGVPIGGHQSQNQAAPSISLSPPSAAPSSAAARPRGNSEQKKKTKKGKKAGGAGLSVSPQDADYGSDVASSPPSPSPSLPKPIPSSLRHLDDDDEYGAPLPQSAHSSAKPSASPSNISPPRRSWANIASQLSEKD
jgi:hypothetical protein